MNHKPIWIIKADGAKVPFDLHKVISTCIRAGSSRKMAKKISERVRNKIHDGMRTSDVYRMVLDALKIEDESTVIGHRYRLKESIMRMGPAGYRFETYVGEILGAYGYNVVSTRSIEQGKCVKHEIDLNAEFVSTGKKYLIECKYHNMTGLYTGLKESLYTHARFLDLDDKYDGEMLVCNTKLSSDARTYAQCIGQQIISWRYPPGRSLENMIEEKGLYPITILGLNKYEIISFARNEMMLVKDLLTSNLNILSGDTGISYKRLERLRSLANKIAQ